MAIEMDSNENIIITGHFGGVDVDFNPGPMADSFSSNGSGHHQMADRLYTESLLTGVYEQSVEPIPKSGTRPQEGEPTSALMRRYHR